MQKFVITGLQRTGTTMIVRTLDQHENIVCFGEMFIGKYPNKTPGSYQIWYRQTRLRRLQKLVSEKHCIQNYLDEIYSAPEYLFNEDQKREACMAMGFKLMYNQANQNPSILGYIKARQLPILLLVRKNYLRVVVSRSVRKIFELAHTNEKVRTPPVEIDTKKLLSSLEHIEAANSNWERLIRGNSYLKVYYEDFVSDRAEQLNQITDFLRVPRNSTLVPPTVKLNPDKLEEVILNYAEVVKTIRDTRFAHLLTQ